MSYNIAGIKPKTFNTDNIAPKQFDIEGIKPKGEPKRTLEYYEQKFPGLFNVKPLSDREKFQQVAIAGGREFMRQGGMSYAQHADEITEVIQRNSQIDWESASNLEQAKQIGKNILMTPLAILTLPKNVYDSLKTNPGKAISDLLLYAPETLYNLAIASGLQFDPTISVDEYRRRLYEAQKHLAQDPLGPLFAIGLLRGGVKGARAVKKGLTLKPGEVTPEFSAEGLLKRGKEPVPVEKPPAVESKPLLAPEEAPAVIEPTLTITRRSQDGTALEWTRTDGATISVVKRRASAKGIGGGKRYNVQVEGYGGYDALTLERAKEWLATKTVKPELKVKTEPAAGIPISSELESLARANPMLFKRALKAINVDEFIDSVVRADKTTREKVSIPALTDFYNRVHKETPAVEAKGDIYYHGTTAGAVNPATRTRSVTGKAETMVVFDNSQIIPLKKAPTPGAGKPAEFTTGIPVEEMQGAIYNRATKQAREQLGLPEISTAEYSLSMPELGKRAKEAVDNGIIKPDKLIDSFLENPRPLTDIEQSALAYRAKQLWTDKNRKESQLLELQRVQETPTLTNERVKLERDLLDLNEQFLRTYDVGQASGTMWSSAGRARQGVWQGLEEADWTLEIMTRRRAIKNSGKELPPEEYAKIKEQAEKIREYDTKLKQIENDKLKIAEDKTLRKLKVEAAKEERSAQRKFAKEDLAVEFEGYVNELIKITQGQLNVGIDPAAVGIMTKMAKNRIKSGLLTAEEIVDSIYTSLQKAGIDWDKRIIRDAISGYGITKKMNQAELAKAMREAKAQMRSISRLEDVIEGKKPSRTGLEWEKQSAIVKDLEKQVREGMRERGLNQDTKLQTYKTRLQNEIAEFERRIKEGDYGKKTKRETELDKEAFSLRWKRDNIKNEYMRGQAKYEWGQKSLLQKSGAITREAFQLPRAILASMDFSAVLRQGGFVVAAHPLQGIRALPQMFRAISEKGEYRVMQELMKDPIITSGKLKEMGVDLTQIGGKLIKQEEFFQSRLAGHLPGVSHSQRAFTTITNVLRVIEAKTLLKNIEKNGIPATKAELHAIGNLVNVATGRGGGIGSLSKALVEANTVFFAPRYMLSRFQLITGQPLLKGIISGESSARVRRAIAGEYARAAGTFGTVLYIGHLTGADISFDPTSADFLKLRYGKLRIDAGAGALQAGVFINRSTNLGLEIGKNVLSEVFPGIKKAKIKWGQDAGSIIGNFLLNKLNPAVGVPVRMALPESDYRKLYLRDLPKSLAVPLTYQDVYDVLVGEGWEPAAAVGVLSAFGMGVQYYEEKEKKKKKSYY